MSERCPECGGRIEAGEALGGQCPSCSLRLGLEAAPRASSEAPTLGLGVTGAVLASSSLEAGTRLGRYEILAPLGRGGMGEVYRARDHRLEREVALKVLAREALPGTEGLERLRREARLVSRLSHPHVCTIYDLESYEDLDFLVMELLRGATLAERLAKGPLPEAEVATIAREVASALGEAHRQGLVHRDLKPANVMLTETGSKLLDFGVAKALDSPSPSQTPAPESLTRPGSVIGTLQYMAPEQLEGRDVDARSDLFAFGALVLEMLTGHKAFDGESEASVIGAILYRDPPALSDEAGAVPPPWRPLLRRCLAKSPAERPQSAAEVLEALEALGSDSATSVESAVATTDSMALAVLRFEAPGGGGQDRALAEGLTDEVFTRLSRWGRFPVVGHHPALAAAAPSVDLKSVSRELGVRYVVMGTVHSAGDRARIHARLVEAETGNQVWADRFDRELDDLFAVQDDVAAGVVSGIRRDLWDYEHRRAQRRGSEDSAWDLAQRGFGLLTRFREESNGEARRWFEKALARDPGLISAGYGLVMTYFVDIANGWVEDRQDSASAAMEVAERCVDRDENNPLARIAEGVAFFLVGDIRRAVSALELAVEQDPGHNAAHVMLAFFATLAGDVKRAGVALKTATRLGIEAPLVWMYDYTRALVAFVSGDDATTVELAQRCLDLRPQFHAPRSLLAASLGYLGRADEGREVLVSAGGGAERRVRRAFGSRAATAVGQRLRGGLERLAAE